MKTLSIKQVRYYNRARYPRLIYRERQRPYPLKLGTAGLTSAALLALIGSACLENNDTRPGLVGPPPMPPDYVTENEARSVINQVFARNGIKLDADVPLSFLTSQKDRVTLNLDGYNRQLNIGYEYVYRDDSLTFTPGVVSEMDKASETNQSGPFIIAVTPPGNPAEIEQMVQEFITSLRARGLL